MEPVYHHPASNARPPRRRSRTLGHAAYGARRAGPDPVGGTRDIRPRHRWAPGPSGDLYTCRATPGRRPARAEALDGITLRDRMLGVNARRAADPCGLLIHFGLTDEGA